MTTDATKTEVGSYFISNYPPYSLWMHENLRLTYGWVLVVFGVLVRLLLWPLNAHAMRAQMKNMEIQPKLKEQNRLASDIRRMTAVRPQRSESEPPSTLPATAAR